MESKKVSIVSGGIYSYVPRRKLQTLRVSSVRQEMVASHLLRNTGEIRWHFHQQMTNMLGFDPSVNSLPRSEYEPKYLIEGILNYDGPSIFDPDKTVWAKAYDIIKARYSGSLSAIPMDRDRILAHIKRNTSAGYPYKGKLKGEVYNEAFEDAVSVSNNEKDPYPCTAFVRTQGRKKPDGPPKVRLVWGYPLEMIILESRYAIPILDHIQTHVVTSALGRRKVQLATQLECLRTYPVIYKADWSKFDATVPTQIIAQCFEILRPLFSESEGDYDIIKRYFCTCGIISPTGEVITRRRKGIPSGSFFTSIIGTMVNEFVTTYLFLRQGVKWDGMYLGDDSIVGLNSRVDTTKMKLQALKEFGMKLDTEKLNYGHSIEFLGHYWESGRGMRPIEESIRRLAYPERWNLNVKMSDLVSSLYGDNPELWRILPFHEKMRITMWRGPDLSGFAAWDNKAKHIGSDLLTL